MVSQVLNTYGCTRVYEDASVRNYSPRERSGWDSEFLAEGVKVSPLIASPPHFDATALLDEFGNR